MGVIYTYVSDSYHCILYIGLGRMKNKINIPTNKMNICSLFVISSNMDYINKYDFSLI